MFEYEDFPKKCLKCKRSDVPLERFQAGYVRSKYIQGGPASRVQVIEYNSYSVKFPVCRSYKIQFNRYLMAEKFFYTMICLNIPTFFITIIFTFVHPPINFPFNILPFTISFILTVILAILVRIYPHKIQNYIEATENGVILKDPIYEKEFYDYKMSRMVEDKLDINKIPCPKCGSLIRKDVDFCLSCGKDLRNYAI
jgi:hypothetical protein